VAFNGNDRNLNISGNITQLAREGVILNRHYVHWHCSPTRRSFLTGRLPIHHSEKLSGISDDIDLRWKTIGEKLTDAGYASYWFGKGHTGYKSVRHLPTGKLGFRNFTGYLGGAQSYYGPGRWEDGRPLTTKEYSCDLYGGKVLDVLAAHDPGTPLFLYLPWQNVHEPYQAPPDWTADVYRGMLWAADVYMGRIVALLKKKQMFADTLVLYSADNGGVDKGSNFPLRGEKHTNYEGGMRGAAFVSGGYLKQQYPTLVGTNSSVVHHIVDWYPTMCALAGIDSADDSPLPPLPADPADPTKDLYRGGASWPPIDGRDMLPALLQEQQAQQEVDATASAGAGARQVWLSTEVLVEGPYKLLVMQPSPHLTAMGNQYYNFGWHKRNDVAAACEKLEAGCWEWPVQATTCACGCAFNETDRVHPKPCLFDVDTDREERHDVSAAHPDVVARLWAALNKTNLELYGGDHSPPALLGHCDKDCADKYYSGNNSRREWELEGWEVGTKGNANHPICGVPGC